jgi:hypothetical protein
MAVVGIFQADFASFVDAVQKAETQLRSFDSGAAKVESSLSRMTDTFSGRKVIQEATMMAEVFERAGGASSFTEKELARMAATGSEAVAKLTALGQDIPPGLQRIASETRSADKETSGLTTSVKNLAAGFAAMFTARAAFDFIKSTAAEAGALADLSAQTRIGVEELQVMGNAMAGFGVSTDELGRAVFGLSRRIANGDDGAADALAQMGLTLEDVRGLNGEELFLTIQRGLSKLQGGLRDTAAVELYGQKLGMSMAGAAEGTDAAIEAARRMNDVMSDETVRALDEADEAVQRMTRSLTNMAANVLGNAVLEVEALNRAAGQGATNWDLAIAKLKDWGAQITGTGTGTEHLARLFDELNQQTALNTTTTQGAAAAAEAFVGPLETTAQAAKRAADALKELNKLEADYAKLKSETSNANQLALMEDEAAAMKQRAEQEAMFAEQEIQSRLRRQEALNAQVAAESAAEAQRVAANQAEIDGLLAAGAAHQEAGAIAKAASDLTVAGYQGVAQQITMTGEAVREWIRLMQYTAEANAILSENSLFTTTSQKQRIAAIGGGFSANLPASASMGGGGGQTFHNTFQIVDTESNIAHRVSDNIMRQVKSGSQLTQ